MSDRLLAQRVAEGLLRAFPEWEEYVDTVKGGELEVAVPAPEGSSAGWLVVFTDRGEHLWVRFNPPQMCYALDDVDEMVRIVGQLIRDEAIFVVVHKGEEWAETTLIQPGDEPPLEKGQTAQVVSWSRSHDRVVKA